MTEQFNKLPRFTAAERTFLRMRLFDGLTGEELLKSFKHFFYPGNNYCATKRDVTTWKKRVFHINDKLDKSNEFKDLLKQAKTGLALKDARIANRKNALSRLEYLLTEYEGHKYSQMDKDWQDGFIKLCNLRIKELKDLAIELGEYKTTSINVDQRKQLNVYQQQNVFGGQATVPHLEGDNATGLRIVAPSVEALGSPDAIRGRDPYKEVEQPCKHVNYKDVTTDNYISRTCSDCGTSYRIEQRGHTEEE